MSDLHKNTDKSKSTFKETFSSPVEKVSSRKTNIFQRKKWWIVSLVIIILLTLITFLTPIQTNNDSRIIEFSNAVFDFSEISTPKEISLDISLGPTERIPRVVTGIMPTYNLKINNLFNVPYKKFTESFTIIINYTNAYLDEVKEETLAIYWFDNDQPDKWERLETELDITQKKATTKSHKTGKFALMGEFKTPPPPPGYYQKKYPISEWKTFLDNNSALEILYPPNWDLVKKEYYEENEAFSVSALGDKQAAGPMGTELFDGAMVNIYTYPDEGKTTQEWANDFATTNWYQSEIARKIKFKRLGDNNFYVAEHCNEDISFCDTDYFTSSNGIVYRVNTLTIGKDALVFYEIASEIVMNLRINQFTSDTILK